MSSWAPGTRRDSWGTHGSEAADFADRLGARLGPTATFATTEHFNLQTARSIDQAAIFVPPAQRPDGR
jgi:hypothetical protein